MDSKVLEQMLESGQDSPMLRCTLGMLSLKKELFEVAVDHFEAALEMEPDHSASWKGLGKALMALERYEQAQSVYRKGIQVAESKGDVQAAKEMKVFLKRAGKASD